MSTDGGRDLFHHVGVAVAISQVFEVIFVIASKLALKQADVAALEDVEALSKSKAFKQASKALLNELAQAGLVDSSLEASISSLIEDRHKIVHRSFLECGWPGPMSAEVEGQFVALCARVSTQSMALCNEFVDLTLNWMKKYPATSPTALMHEEKFRELATRMQELDNAP